MIQTFIKNHPHISAWIACSALLGFGLEIDSPGVIGFSLFTIIAVGLRGLAAWEERDRNPPR